MDAVSSFLRAVEKTTGDSTQQDFFVPFHAREIKLASSIVSKPAQRRFQLDDNLACITSMLTGLYLLAIASTTLK
jgi:hypothetical protein